MPWLISSVLERTAKLISNIISFPLLVSLATGKRSYLISCQLKKTDATFDWIIAHNPAAFFPAFQYSKKKNIKLGIDVEDYHPGESNDGNYSSLMKKLMQYCLPSAKYVSFAAPLIQKEIEKDLHIVKKSWITVLNYFPATEFVVPDKEINGPVQLIWFSQNIREGRGLENIISAIRNTGSKINLHLFGNLDEAFANTFLKDAANIFIHHPVSQQELHRCFMDYDIGLALDIAVDRNREIAVTNKILAYLQSGLFLIATDTLAQRDILDEFSDHGLLFKYKSEQFEVLLSKVISDIKIIRNNKIQRFKAFQGLCWEEESKKLTKIWTE